MGYAGIDWADDHHDAVIIDEAGQRVASCRVAHTPDGLTQLVTFLQATVGSTATPQELACLIETTHGLLITALLDAGLAVYPVNPKTVDRRRKPSGAKTVIRRSRPISSRYSARPPFHGRRRHQGRAWTPLRANRNKPIEQEETEVTEKTPIPGISISDCRWIELRSLR